ncbi:MAG: AraC family transcriptional regulator [Myxococcales bacterium]|nr:AraC family transcriptional regulator [Myxococcales bacterium]
MPHWTLPRPAGSAQLMITVARQRYGVPLSDCLENTSLGDSELTDPAREISGQQELIVLRNVLTALGPDVPFGLEAGLSYRATTHGMWGFAVMTSANVREAIDVGVRYAELTYSFNRLECEHAADHSTLRYDERDNPDDVRPALVERDLGALIALERDALGWTTPFRALRLRAPRPSYAARFVELFGVEPQFDAPDNAVVFDLAGLEASGPLADELAFRTGVEQCRQLLELRREHAGTAGRVRERILSTLETAPGMESIATDLGMSVRTLRNHLAREGTCYRELVEGLREALALELLASPRLNVEQIAARLGYTDTSSFITAFKRWKGVPPSHYRRDTATAEPRAPTTAASPRRGPP